ncbi:unnamed protein product [Owenia fusiformis]|uniref:PH domain-containing protein n=1 Tax=Owenia fusiformis TaxID=6347 RepID=A0A8S4N3W5_OWEFU|nr:unnamed protein product [Owenia fusiformis]
MHELFAKVLAEKDLSKAGDLFSLEDKDINDDLGDVLVKIQEIADTPGYIDNDNDQSVVEICITRVTSAIREMRTIEQHIESLVGCLESCLKHELKPPTKDEDTPHAKIASDIMSCIFLNYNRKLVMSKAIPTAVRFLQEGSRDLSRNMSSYLSLAAIDNAELLSPHLEPIINSIIQGNKALTRVLPQIYGDNKGPINRHIGDLVAILDDCETSERTSLLQLYGLIAKHKPSLLESYITQLCVALKSSSTSNMVLQIFVDMATTNGEPFVSHMITLQDVASQQPQVLSLVARIVGQTGKLNKMQANESINYLVSQLSGSDQNTLPILLKELANVSSNHPEMLHSHLSEISLYSESSSAATRVLVQQLKDSALTTSSGGKEMKSTSCQTDGTVTVITVGNPPPANAWVASLGSTTSDVAVGQQPSAPSMVNSTQQTTQTPPVMHISMNIPQNTMLQPHNGGFVPHNTGQAPRNANSLPHNAVTSSHNQPTRPHVYTRSPNHRDKRQSNPNIYHRSNSNSNIAKRMPRPSSTGPELRHRIDRPHIERPHSVMTTTSTHSAGSSSTNHSAVDPVLHFCERHMDKIRNYISHVSARIPEPVVCVVEENKHHKRYLKLSFNCSMSRPECLYSQNYFIMRSKLPKLWIHLKFLALQASAERALSRDHAEVHTLKRSWDALKTDGSNTFTRVVTAAFPSLKDQELLIQELNHERFFDVFEYGGIELKIWGCFICNHPQKYTDLLQDGNPVIEGQLKEKRGKWKFLKRWKTRYFTLSGATMTYNKKDSKKETFPVREIKTVKAVCKGTRDIPRAFEIFTHDNTQYVFKPKDGKNAQDWVQCLNIAVARSQKPRSKEAELRESSQPDTTRSQRREQQTKL